MSARGLSNVVAIGIPNAADIFAKVSEAPLAEREALLERLCGPHVELRDRLAAMLRAHATSDANTLGPGSIVADRYELREAVGRGSTAVVWAARDRKMQREVALKIFDTEGTRRRWREVVQEAWAVADVDHPHVIRVHDVGSADEDVLYIDMQLSRGLRDGQPAYGSPLSAVFAQNAREAAHWIEQAARGVQAAHDKAVFSGDVKPHNMLLEPGGNVAMTDFGLGIRLAGTREPTPEADQTITYTRKNGNIVGGTPAYMSPEQAEGTPRPLDPRLPAERDRLVRSDVYGLGASLYHLLADHPPYRADLDTIDRNENVLDQVLAEPPAPVERVAERLRVPAQLARIVRRAMDRNAAQRYPSAAALADDLERFRNHQPTSLDRGRPLLRALLFTRRKPALVLNGVALLVLGILVSFGAVQAKDLERQNTELARRDAELARRDAEIVKRDAEIAGLDRRAALARAQAADAQRNAAKSIAEQNVKVAQADAARRAAEEQANAAREDAEHARRAEASAIEEARKAKEAETAAISAKAIAEGESAKAKVAESRALEAATEAEKARNAVADEKVRLQKAIDDAKEKARITADLAQAETAKRIEAEHRLAAARAELKALQTADLPDAPPIPDDENAADPR